MPIILSLSTLFFVVALQPLNHSVRAFLRDQGSYTQITDVYAGVIAWMEANGYEPAEQMFNIYHVSPHET